jgi:hypothetical protein
MGYPGIRGPGIWDPGSEGYWGICSRLSRDSFICTGPGDRDMGSLIRCLMGWSNECTSPAAHVLQGMCIHWYDV